MNRTAVRILVAVLAVTAPLTLLAQHGAAAAHDAAPHPTAPAAHVAAPKPAAATADAAKHGSENEHIASPAPRVTPPTSRSKQNADGGLSSALTRIQERIAMETAPNAKSASTNTSASRRPSEVAPTGSVLRSPGAPKLVTLRWRIALDWPAELLPAPAPESAAKIDLKWE